MPNINLIVDGKGTGAIVAIKEVKKGLSELEQATREAQRTAEAYNKKIEQSNKKMKEFGRVTEKTGHVLRNMGVAITAGVTTPLVGLIAKSTMAAARVSTMGVVLGQLNRLSGQTEGTLMKAARSVATMGIEMASAQEIVAKFYTAQLDLANVADLARIAQDQAVISGLNSTETMERLTNAILSGNVLMFRNLRMIINMDAAYEDLAGTLGKAADDLTQLEKVQARVNAVLEYGGTIAGIYESAMDDAFKRLGSYPRYLNEIAVAIGDYFMPAFQEAVFAGSDLLVKIKEMVSEGGALEPLFKDMGDQVFKIAEKFGDWTENLDELDPVMVGTVGDIVKMTAAMGPLLLVGGQMLIWVGKLSTAMGELKIASAFGLSGAGFTGIAGVFAVAVAASVKEAIKWKNVIQQTQVEVEGYHKELALGAGTYKEYAQAIEDNNKGVSDYAQSLGLASIASSGMGTSAQYMAQSADNAAKSIKVLTEEEWDILKMLAYQEQLQKISEASERAATHAASYYPYLDMVEESASNLTTTIMDLGEEMTTFDGIFGIAKDAAEEMGISLDEESALMRDMALAAGEATEGDITMKNAIFDLTAQLNDGLVTNSEYIATLLALSEAASDGAVDVWELHDALDNLPREVRTDILIHTFNYETMITGETAPRAAGGPIYAAAGTGAYWVGEVGPELFIPSQSGRVLSNSDSMAGFGQITNAIYQAIAQMDQIMKRSAGIAGEKRAAMGGSPYPMGYGSKPIETGNIWQDFVTFWLWSTKSPPAEQVEAMRKEFKNILGSQKVIGGAEFKVHYDMMIVDRYFKGLNDLGFYWNADKNVWSYSPNIEGLSAGEASSWFNLLQPWAKQPGDFEQIMSQLLGGIQPKNMLGYIYEYLQSMLPFEPKYGIQAEPGYHPEYGVPGYPSAYNISGYSGGITININSPINTADETFVERTLAPYVTKAIREATR